MSHKNNPSKLALQKVIEQQNNVINDLVQEVFELKQKMKEDYQELNTTRTHNRAA